MKRLFILAICLGLSPAAGQAASSSGEFAAEGAGQLACRDYVQAAEAKSDLYWMIGGWVGGFLTAYNAYVDDTFDVTAFSPSQSTDLMMSLIHRHCTDNAGDSIGLVVKAMAEQMHRTRLRARSEVLEAEVDGASYPIYRDVLVRVQELLQAKGYYDGAIDGVFGPRVEAALAGYQAAEGLPGDGAPTPETLLRLLVKG